MIRSNVLKAATRSVDNDYAIWRVFDNQHWPALYFIDFIDARGRVRHYTFW